MRTTQEVWAASRPIQRPAKPIPETKARRTATGVPTRMPHAVVCGQLPSSQSPAMGSASAVSLRISLSEVKSRPHRCLTATVKTMARTPISTAQASATSAAARAPAGRRAPSSLPTRVETPRLSEDGKT
ncbi:unnamed protein product [Spirodela intermedia]|uniref:Uncharacterized protein n=1 Tax=Spirodela intermedia TaxID=51605 RepID=A0A7I8K7Z7_SPIIN|nr:unnamed protein product [Spirodela intermedia]